MSLLLPYFTRGLAEAGQDTKSENLGGSDDNSLSTELQGHFLVV